MAQTKKPLSSRMFRLVAGLVFCWMLLLNCLTPYLADDYTFAYAFDTGERLHSLPQLISSLVFHYHEWSGRVIVKFFAQGFTMFPKLLFNVCNAGMFMALGLVLYKLAVGRRSQKADWLALALIYAALWEISPVFGQTNLWMCGACNYLWATVGCCAFLLPWRYYLQQPFASTARMAAGMALAGLLAGWLSENTSAGMLVCLVLAGAVVFKRERRLPAWMATGLAGALVGFALLITARGNFNRASGFSDYDSLLTRYAMRFFACLNMLKDYALPLLFSFAILFLLLCFARQDAVKADLLWPLILLAGALGANFAMIGSHDYYPRSTHGAFALLAAACAACLVQLNSKAFRRGLVCLSACVGIVCGIHMLEAGYDIASYWMMDHVRTQTLRQEISELDEPAAANIISYGIEPYTKWCGAYGLPDIRENGEDSLALGRARWFGVTSITATETRTYPFAGHTNETYAAGKAAAENAESMD